MVAIFVALIIAAAPVSVGAQTEEDVAQAERERDEAYAQLIEARNAVDAAVAHYQEITGELADVERRIESLTLRIASSEAEEDTLTARVQSTIVDAYMTAGAGSITEVTLEARSIQDVLTAQALLERAADADLATMTRLDAITRQLEGLETVFVEDAARLSDLQADAAVATEELADLMASAEAELQRTDAAAIEARRRYEAELRRQREEEERKRREEEQRRGGGGSAVAGLVCPVEQPVSFINDWGFPRSGGRTHKGTDMFASYGNEIYAVTSGTVKARDHGLGGIHVWLYGDDGNEYYLAHMSGWGPGIETGVRVAQGQVIGYIGTSGNAAGTPPHTHLQIHPGGSGASNPYTSMAAACG